LDAGWPLPVLRQRARAARRAAHPALHPFRAGTGHELDAQRPGQSLPGGRQRHPPAAGSPVTAPTLAEVFAELRHLCEEEDYTLELQPRKERPNPFPDALDELAR